MRGCGFDELGIEVDDCFDKGFGGFEEIGAEVGDDRIDEFGGFVADDLGVL